MTIESYLDRGASLRPVNPVATAPKAVSGERLGWPKKVASVLVAVYFFNLWQVPNFSVTSLNWYHVLPFTCVVFLLSGGRINKKQLKVGLIVFGLMYIGAVLSLFRAENVDVALRNTVGLAVTSLAMLMLVPALTFRLTRRLMAWAVLIAAIMRVWLITTVTAQSAGESPHLFAGGGDDKNFMSLCLALGVTLMMILFFMEAPRRRFRLLNTKLARHTRSGLLIGMAVLFVYAAAITYSRSGLITCIISIMAVLGVQIIRKKLVGFMAVGTLGVLGVISVYLYLPVFLEQFPYWETNYLRLVNWSSQGYMQSRKDLLEKGILIVAENPVIGVGVGLSKFSDVLSDWTGEVVHNGYLSVWAELGLLGIGAMLYVVGTTIGQIWWRAKLADSDPLGMALVLLLVPILFMNLFLDMSPVISFSIALLSSLAFDRQKGNGVRRSLYRRPLAS